MEINAANLESMYFAFDARFQQAFTDTTNFAPTIATEVPSTTRENRYPWVDLFPRMREWVGERVVRNMSARVFAIQNKAWELTLEVDREDIEDDNLGLSAQRAAMMGRQAKKWPDHVIADVVKAGHTTICADGQFFWDTDHPINLDNPGAGTYSNKLSLALNAANFGAARAAMRAFTGADTNNLNAEPNVLMVPPALEDTARAIIQAETLAPTAAWAGNVGSVAVSNIYRNSASVLVVPELNDDPTRWYLLDTSKAIKPFIWQLRKAPNFVALINETDTDVFWRKKYVYGVDSRGNGGFTMPFLALTSKP